MANVDTDIRSQVDEYELDKKQMSGLRGLLRLCHTHLEETNDEMITVQTLLQIARKC